MKTIGRCTLALSWALTLLPALPSPAAPVETPGLTVVQDLGGASALPYYRALNLQPRAADQTATLPIPAAPHAPYREADHLPVRSARLSPGTVEHRVIQAPGLTPIFLIGDDGRSRAWLQQRVNTLRSLYAVGFVVNVDSPERLESLRRLAPGLMLSATPGDDLAERLGIDHYPVLITATGIEQ
jgi:integrating conjugative element protein (TIGR03765 family)